MHGLRPPSFFSTKKNLVVAVEVEGLMYLADRAYSMYSFMAIRESNVWKDLNATLLNTPGRHCIQTELWFDTWSLGFPLKSFDMGHGVLA